MNKKITLFSLAIPIFFELVLFMTLGIIDTFMLSKFSDYAAGAVGVANQVINFANIFFNIICTGVSVLISQYIGAKKIIDSHKTMIISYVIITFIGILCSVVLYFYGNSILIKMGITPNMEQYTKPFIKIIGSFIFLQAFLNVSTVIMRCHGFTKNALYITAGMNILNIIGDYCLLFGIFGLPNMGVAGIAIATSFSRLFAVIASFVFVAKNILPLSAVKYLKELPIVIVGKLLKIGLPATLETISYNIGQTIISMLVLTYLGEEISITRTYVMSIVSFFLIFSIAISQSNQILIGRLIGERKPEKAYKTCFKHYKITLTIVFFVGLIFYFFGSNLIQIFSYDLEIVQLGITILMIDALLEPGRILNMIFISGLRGSGDVIYSSIIGIVFTWLLAVFGSYYLGVILGLGLPGIWIAMLLDEWTRGILNMLRWKSKKWMTKSLVELDRVSLSPE